MDEPEGDRNSILRDVRNGYKIHCTLHTHTKNTLYGKCECGSFYTNSFRTHMKSDRLCASIYVPRDGGCLCAYKPVSLFVYVNRYNTLSMCTYGKYADRSYSVDRGYFVG